VGRKVKFRLAVEFSPFRIDELEFHVST
jgi:hypothetical protein